MPALITPEDILAALPFALDAMTVDDIPVIMTIERQAFSLAWSSGIYRRELSANPWSHYRLLRARPDDCLNAHLPPILAYGGMWQMGETAHIPTIATHPQYCSRQLGSYLFLCLLQVGQQLGCTEATLEVRISNVRSQALYSRFGFEAVGHRRRYYSDNQEDALIMTRPQLDPAILHAELATVIADLRRIWLIDAGLVAEG